MLKDFVRTQPETQVSKLQWQKLAVVGGIIVLVSLIGWIFGSQYLDGLENSSEPVMSAAAFEEQTGVRINMIAVTGGGGLLDVRFKILDVEKATNLFQDAENRPVLIVEGRDIAISPPAEVTFEEIDFIVDRAYPLLYVNQEGSVQTGTLLTVVIGEFRIEHIVAQ